MASYQRVALYIFFDAIERDLIDKIRSLPLHDDIPLLSADEAEKARRRLEYRDGASTDLGDQFALLSGLDLGDKYAILMRHKTLMDQSNILYYSSQAQNFSEAIPIRNATMHGRPLTTIQFATGFQIANTFLKSGIFWPNLNHTFRQYDADPHAYIGKSVALLDDYGPSEALNNLPAPDYEDTGFLPRPTLERDLRKKILGRHPVITVLGDGGNGKTALVLQTLYGMLASNDHGYDAIVWVSAKTARLTIKEIERIEGAITHSLDIFEDIANQFEPGNDSAPDRVRKLLGDNKILLVIDNLETVLDENLRAFAAEIPGDSKLVFTSRVPLGSDLSVSVGDFDIKEARTYLRRLIEAYDISALRSKTNDQIDAYTIKLGRKPLLLKWFALGVASGLTPERIVSQPDIALRFCMENVVDSLSHDAKSIAVALSFVPSPLSAALIQHILEIPATNTEAGVAELIRFGLIQRDSANRDEIIYQLRTFAKSYLAKMVKPEANLGQDILKRYRAVDGLYQSERGTKDFNRYDQRSFVVRNRSEALAAQKLKKVLILAYRGEISSAEDLLQDSKMISSDYFEVFRTEATLAMKSGDISRAQDAYEAAIELASDQPQLHVAYAGFFSRYLSDFKEASKILAVALDLDPSAHYVLQEAARNAMFSYDFHLARTLIGRAKSLTFKTYREEIIFADLTTQLYYREADYLAKTGDYVGASKSIRDLIDVIGSTDRNLFDEKHLDHLGKVFGLISELRRNPQYDDTCLLDELAQLLRTTESEVDPARGLPYMSASGEHDQDVRIGYLKPEGRRDTFGFLRDQAGIETYLSRYMVEDLVWEALCAGRRASFSIAPARHGHTAAVNLRLLP